MLPSDAVTNLPSDDGMEEVSLAGVIDGVKSVELVEDIVVLGVKSERSEEGQTS